MIEILLRNYLSENLSAPVYLEYPEGETVPKEHVMIEKLGSMTRNHITSTSIAIQSYGGRLCNAMQLNEEVKAAMKNIVRLNEIGSARLNSDYDFTDTEKKQYRYQAVYDITHY